MPINDETNLDSEAPVFDLDVREVVTAEQAAFSMSPTSQCTTCFCTGFGC
jgi:hypothetical protein